jgi:hypothetical protein
LRYYLTKFWAKFLAKFLQNFDVQFCRHFYTGKLSRM